MQKKYDVLLKIIGQYKKVGVCLSGGSGSALVAIAAAQALGKESVVGITVNTPFFTGEDMESSRDLCDKLGIRLLTPNANLLMDPDIIANTEKRCYYCKRAIIKLIREAAAQEQLDVLLDGTSARGNAYYGQGNEAISEYGIVCPLRLANISREEMYALLSEQGMSYFIQPENACLVTRIPIGEPISLKKIRWIRAAENYIRSLGFNLVRVRLHGTLAKVEVKKEEVPELLRQQEKVKTELLAMGFIKSVEIDKNGYKRETASCL